MLFRSGQEAKAVHNVSFGESFVQASSSKNPAFPSILIVEAMAQTGAIALLSEEKFAGKTAYFGGIKEADFTGQARPGDQIILMSKLLMSFLILLFVCLSFVHLVGLMFS